MDHDGASPTRSEDTLCEREIHFPPYDAGDLEAILDRRTEFAFKQGVLDDEVVPLCAAFAAQDRGSARQALDLLFEAGDLARRNDRKRVTEAHVRQGRQLLEKRQIEQSLLDLTIHGHLTLFAVTVLTINDATPARKEDIYRRYNDLVLELDREPLSDRSVHSHLNELVMLGVLNRHEYNQGRAGGIYYEYELAVALDTVLSALEDVHALDGVDIEALRARA